jgi:hypothetical protein
MTVAKRPMTAARAEMIARNEVASVYRQTRMAGAEGYDYFEMTGPRDMKTSSICDRHIGQIKTRAEWQRIHPLVFVYGLHPNCRHSWDPVPDAAAGQQST